MSEAVFTHDDARLGRFGLRPVRPVSDAPRLHAWLTHPRSRYWEMLDATPQDVVDEQLAIAASASRKAFVGLHDDTPRFLVETYDPARSELADVHDLEPGDVGMHVLVAPPTTRVHGLTRAVMTTIMTFLFSDPTTRRVVVEPDASNTAIHRRNHEVGFRVVGEVELSSKRALLGTCTRDQFLHRHDDTVRTS